MAGTHLRRNPVGGLANDSNHPHQSKVEQLLCVKIGARAALNQGLGVAGAIQHVTQTDVILTF
jgi:hypothetical protein